ncbi:MAG: asparagine synthase (glutamine-hydrolyzing) [Pseudomonadota bacterium]
MCGIAGCLVYRDNQFEIDEKYLAAMRDVMRHRGPDGQGHWISPDRKIGLAHRRLSIIDLSDLAGQPMCNEDGSVWIVYNGEIYNHADIRNELLQIDGHTWKTDHSDTEMILHAYEQWGIDCIHKFRGMFAIAIWDGRKRRLWLVRDRIGIKPLYYSIHNGRVVFASEIKAILEDPDQKRDVNEQAFYHYLSFLTTPAPDTLFAGIKKIAPGTRIRFGPDGTVVEERYWDVWDHTTPLVGRTDGDIADMLLRELRTAVHLRKLSDVPVGVFLSGGIDSSTNVALFSEQGSLPLKTFSIGYDGDYLTYTNETRYARSVAADFGAQYYEKLLSVDDLLNFLPKMVWLQDEPIADPVCVPIYYVSQLARENGVIVCQVGEGADELFYGYPGWKTSLKVQRSSDRFPFPGLKRLGAGLLGAFPKIRYSFQLEWLRRAGRSQPVFWGGAEAFTQTHKQAILSARLRKQFKNYSSWDALQGIRKRFEQKSWEPTHLHWMSYLDLNLRLPELLLMRIDKMSMGQSLEGRVPFLDHKFVELVMSIPSEVKTRGGDLKYILKKAVKGIIPQEIIARPKQGFNVPIYEWFFEKLGKEANKELMRFCRETDFICKSAISDLVVRKRGPQLWYLLNFALWWREYIRGG